MAADKKAIFDEMKEAFGQVPTWIAESPPQSLEAIWSLFRDFHLAETEIPNKYKELIGLAVSGATRCRYCTLFHTEAARLQGATDAEINEASMMGSWTMLSSTYLNTYQVDYDQFKEETRSIVSYIKQKQARGDGEQHLHA